MAATCWTCRTLHEPDEAPRSRADGMGGEEKGAPKRPAP